MEPNWKPLEARLSPARCAGFMFMGRVNGINQYKHGISRRYLLLDVVAAGSIANEQGLVEALRPGAAWGPPF